MPKIKEQLQECQKENLNLQNLLFEAYLFHLEACDDVTPVPDRYMLIGFDEYMKDLKTKWIPIHDDMLTRINLLRRQRNDSN